MAAIAKNEKELRAFLLKQIEPLAKELSETIKEIWQDYIDKRFYDLHPYEPFPTVYKRTYQLYESVVTVKPVISGNTIKMKVFMDKNTADKGYENDDIWTVWNLAAEGYHGDKDPSMRTEGRFFAELIEDLNSGRLFIEFEKLLKSKGIPV